MTVGAAVEDVKEGGKQDDLQIETLLPFWVDTPVHGLGPHGRVAHLQDGKRV